jgi:hypothetical protein
VPQLRILGVGGNYNRHPAMTTKQVIIIVLIISTLTSCRRGYKVEGGKVYYEYGNEGSGQIRRLIEQADAKTFQKLTFDCDCDLKFGKDKDHLFLDGELIKTIDPNTFKSSETTFFGIKTLLAFLASTIV